MAKKSSIDISLLMVVFFLLLTGITMMFSASSRYADYYYSDTFYILKKQLVWAFLGIIAMIAMSNFDYHKLHKYAVPLLFGTMVLLAAVFIPGLGIETKGARRWLGVGGLSFQPSELAKLSIIIFLASSLSKKKNLLKYFLKGFIPYIAIIGMVAGLIIIEPHLSSTVIVCGVGAVLLFVAGAKLSHFAVLGFPVILGIIGAVVFEPYRFDRIKAFMDPWKYASKEGYQITQSLMAIGSGGLIGVGLGLSKQKQLYIPEPHNDFVFSIIGEELGLLGCVFVLLLFLVFIWKGIKVAVYSQDLFGSLLAIGIISLIAFQVIINVAVVTSSMPVTGQPLPFFSAGGTSLVFLLAGVGILLNISRFANYEKI